MTGIPIVEMTDHLEENIMHRAKSYLSSKNSVVIQEDADDVFGSKEEKTKSLFCRSSECELVNLEDFQLINVIGRGNFGKVLILTLINRMLRYTWYICLRISLTLQ